MDFLPDAPLAAPVGGTLSVLAVITVGGNAVKGVDEGGNALTRVLSGRRRSSAGMSADGDHTHDKNHQHPPGDGTYFWRAKVGVTNVSRAARLGWRHWDCWACWTVPRQIHAGQSRVSEMEMSHGATRVAWRAQYVNHATMT